jgi:hypothetical protein
MRALLVSSDTACIAAIGIDELCERIEVRRRADEHPVIVERCFQRDRLEEPGA